MMRDEHYLAVLDGLAVHHKELATAYLDHVATLKTTGCLNLAAKYSVLAEEEFHEQALILNKLYTLGAS